MSNGVEVIYGVFITRSSIGCYVGQRSWLGCLEQCGQNQTKYRLNIHWMPAVNHAPPIIKLSHTLIIAPYGPTLVHLYYLSIHFRSIIQANIATLLRTEHTLRSICLRDSAQSHRLHAPCVHACSIVIYMEMRESNMQIVWSPRAQSIHEYGMGTVHGRSNLSAAIHIRRGERQGRGGAGKRDTKC